MNNWSPILLSVLRIVTGFLFIEHGMQKILGFPPSPKPMPFELFSLPGFSGVLELVGGALIILGLFTRVTAFILSGEMAVAYFMVHFPKGFWPIAMGGNGGELAVLYCFVFLYLFAAGGGPFSLDRLISKKL
jgi:putative oxidoreductase